MMSTEKAISQESTTHAAIMDAVDGGETRPGSDLVIARKDEKTGHILVPTPVRGEWLDFRPGAPVLSDEIMVHLGPLGIEKAWNPASVLNFLVDAARRGFDPFSREIFLMRYKTAEGLRYIHHIGIHGMRRHASSTGLFGGIKPIRYCGDDGKWVEVWPYKDAAPYACKVIMLHRMLAEPIEQVGLYDEFVPMKDEWIDNVRTGRKVPTRMWQPAAQGGKPSLMIAKCTQAMAYRIGWTARFGNWYESAEMERLKVESDTLIVDERAQRRQEAYEAATGGRTVDAAEVGVTVTEPDTMPAERVRAMLQAEVDCQAAIIGQPSEFMVRRWQQSRDRTWDSATIGEMAAHIRECRPYIIRALRDQGRHEMADKYADAPMPGTPADLFGGDPRIVTADAEAKVAA